MQNKLTDLTQYLEERLPDALSILEKMVAINSFTANRDGVNRLGELTAVVFAGLGFESRVVPAMAPDLGDHLVLERPGKDGSSNPVVGMISHLDTVYPADEESRNDFHWRPDAERIYGPGTVDIKGGTAMIYLVLSALQELYEDAFEHTRWILLFNAAEEILDPTFGQVAQSVIPAKALACLVFEGGRLHANRFHIVAARKGMVTYRIESEGRAAHAGSSHATGANAITQLARAVDAVASMTDYERNVTFNVGAFTGGTVSNRVPHYAVAQGELRAYSLEYLDEGVEKLLALQDNHSVSSHEGDFACELRVDIQQRWGPWPPNEASDALLAQWQAAAQDMGAEVVREERGGLSDGNHVWHHVPTLDGLGVSGGNAHCSERSDDGRKDQEYLELPSIVPKATLNVLAVLRLLGRHR
jgi:glutamate carboxypeptidase